jgi:hypothetical protein
MSEKQFDVLLAKRIVVLDGLLRRAEGWVGIGCDVDTDKEEYEMVDKLREEIRAALDAPGGESK